MKPKIDTPSVDPSQYVQLRTMLDSVTIGSLRYYLNAASEAEQQRHYKYLNKHLMAIIEKIWAKKPLAGEDGCPDGYYSCDGCCVPYQCFGGIGGGSLDSGK